MTVPNQQISSHQPVSELSYQQESSKKAMDIQDTHGWSQESRQDLPSLRKASKSPYNSAASWIATMFLKMFLFFYFLDPRKREEDVTFGCLSWTEQSNLNRISIGSQCGHWRYILTSGVNVIRLNHIQIQSGYETHFNARCKGTICFM